MRVPEAPLHGDLTVIRPATADDVDLLVCWHADPEVAGYWNREIFTRDEMLARLARSDVDPYIVLEVGEPVGYLQAWFDDDTSGEGGLDMFLIPHARDRGLGPDAARVLARWLLTAGGIRRVAVDPYVSNERGIRAWTKAGFRPIEELGCDDEHHETWLLMVLEATS